MRIAILHLSDFHTKQGDMYCAPKIDRLVEALNVSGGFDECVLIFSGDMSSRGEKSEYSQARKALKRIINKIKSSFSTNFIPLLSVPGNHDMTLNDDCRQHSDIREYYDKGTVDMHLADEFACMSNFFDENFSDNHTWGDKLVYRYFRRYGEYNIQINLLNTAPFSTLKPDDKECHYFPKEKMHLLQKVDESTLCITVMHHSVEWFDWSCKADLEKMIYDNSEFLLTGHDHVGSGRTVSFSNDSGVWVSAAGAMDLSKIAYEDSFNLMVIDTETNRFSGYIFTWNPKDRIYYHKVQVERKEITSKSRKLNPQPSYLKGMKVDPRHKISDSFMEYFVFPKLSINNGRGYARSRILLTYDDFSNYLQTHPVVFIDGESNAGKSTLLRYLYLKLCEVGIPLLWDIAQLQVPVRNLTRNLVPTQYGDEHSALERFQQAKFEEKYILIDNWEMLPIREQKNVLEQLKSMFCHIIISKNITFGEDSIDIEEGVKTALKADVESDKLCIEPFYRSKRSELVRNVCTVYGTLNENDIENVNNAINAMVEHHSSMFILNPEFIIQYTTYFSKEDNHSYQRGEKIFGTIFEFNIKQLIIGSTSAHNVDEYITVLEEISYAMHSQKKDRLPSSGVEIVINEYNQAYAATVSPIKFLEVMFKAKIFCFAGGGLDIAFSNRNYMSYFVARYICRDMMNNGNFDDLNECAKYISYGVNADILMFTTYITSNTRIVRTISESAKSLLSEWQPLSFETDGLRLLSETTGVMSTSIKSPTAKDRQFVEAERELHEERLHDNAQMSTCGIYDNYQLQKYDSPSQRLQRAYAYTEMLSKALPAFSNILKANQKEELIEQIFTYPSRIARAALEPIDKHFDVLTEQMLKMTDDMLEKGQIIKKQTKESIKQILHELAISITLGVINHFAECATDIKTLPLLTAHFCDSEIEQIEHLLILENARNTDELHKYALALLKDNKKTHMEVMVKLIVRKHLIYTTAIPFDKRTRIIDTIFGKQARKELGVIKGEIAV